ncbi:MAG: hypothetical protein JNM06_02240 [Blastocatellia bacterium]|nr:hypothetical protein [Blastocatellia bacterium]
MAYLYTVVLRTAYVDGAGTNADVEIQIKGQSATSQWYVLDNPEDDREKGSQNIYKLYNSTHLGNINGVTLRVKKADEDRPEWCLAEITLVDHDAPHGTVTYVYDCGNVWICPSSYTEWVYYSPESVAQSSSPLTASNTQDGWRWCKKCQGMFFIINSNGVCPKGGGHDASASGYYRLVHNDPSAPGQSDWRWCKKCQGLFFGGNATSICPSSGKHSSSGSGNYTLIHNDTNASGQSDWRWCNKCQGLFFAGNATSTCPAGGKHSSVGSGQYKVDLH